MTTTIYQHAARLLLSSAALAIIAASTASALPEAQRITADNGGQYQRYGTAIAAEGPYALVSAPNALDNQALPTGTIYIYDTSTWMQIATITRPDATAFDAFGTAVAIDGNTAIIGAPWHDHDAIDSGTAYIYDIQTRTRLHELAHEGNALYSYEFGTSVDIAGQYAIVGTNHGSDIGRAFIYDTNTGQRLRTLEPDDPNEVLFTGPVAIDGNTALAAITRGGEHRVLVFDADTGSQRHELQPDQPGIARRFGNAIDIHHDIIVVGSNLSFYNGVASNHGVAYIFDAVSGQQQQRLDPPERVNSGAFGLSVTVSDDTILIGSGIQGGTAYTFNAESGQRIATLRPVQLSGNRFGWATALQDDQAIVGNAMDAALGTQSGAVYRFDLPCSPADVAVPVGPIDLADINNYIAYFLSRDAIADLDGNGIFDAADITGFIAAINEGCAR